MHKHLKRIHSKNPLVLCITNFVTANDCANAILAVGGSPVMSKCIEETQDLLSMAASLVLNIGTVDEFSQPIMEYSAAIADDQNLPLVLDPVGVGATKWRMDVTQWILQGMIPSIIRGNASEIGALHDMDNSNQKGVDAQKGVKLAQRLELAKDLASSLKTVVVVTGAEDVISQGKDTYIVKGGSELLTKITGSGCMLSAIMGAFLSVTPENPFISAYNACRLMKEASERAEESLKRKTDIGEFRVKLFDELYAAKDIPDTSDKEGPDKSEKTRT
ncbi:MAG: hydroxyethylthiazole kinase [Deltaproteobacteria bacterium]|jgi:hydroxyethylthiazole kinase|nr:hydroxyethylthiazole kinase [Deltaproteobacteria bacterium]